ncbi:MAG: DUF2332 domain-containing protein [Allosphingosinicella sp.]
MEREAAVRKAFADQAAYCAQLGSPFTARVCALLGELLDRNDAVGERLLDWPGNPDPMADGVPLRLCGGLHALVRRGDAPSLALHYPPAAESDVAALRSALAVTLATSAEALLPWLENAPQTNEVGRSAALMSGLLVAAARFALPIRLFELGSSAGLNLQLDRYGYDLGGLRTGDGGSPLQLRPKWEGRPPPDADVRIVGRSGVDLNPMDPRREGDRLLAYVWPDQPERLRQLEAALALAATDPPAVARGDAADWVERAIAPEPEPGVIRTVLHSVAFQYFPAAAQQRIADHLARAGARSTAEAPLAWLRFEKRPEDENFSLRLRTWPTGEDDLLAWADPHVRSVHWLRD